LLKNVVLWVLVVVKCGSDSLIRCIDGDVSICLAAGASSTSAAIEVRKAREGLVVAGRGWGGRLLKYGKLEG